ncbi:hypothetical protein KZZ20_05580 [Methylacidiphilum fumariolicum]|nr:hypothetical protein [Candidatus Methylacidiphilum fumarolicum]
MNSHTNGIKQLLDAIIADEIGWLVILHKIGCRALEQNWPSPPARQKTWKWSFSTKARSRSLR